MVSAVKSRPKSHYETLGLNPGASEDEVARAFARQMRLPHAVSEVAQIGIAFDTLRHPAKRRAYDEAMGLRAEPKPLFAPAAISFRASARFGLMPAVGRETEAEPVAKPALPLKPAVEAAVEREPGTRRGTEGVALAAPLPDFLAVSRAPPGRPDRGERGFDWKHPAIAVGALVVAVVVIGAWAGAHAQDPGEQPAKGEVRVAVPAARPRAPVAAPPVEAAAAPVAAPVVRASRAPAKPRASADRLAGIGESLEAASVDDADEAQPAATVSLPLPKAVIARTIHRIGYACGEVASATAVEGEAPGVFKITCTSGQTYQAKPVRGRYHFRRW